MYLTVEDLHRLRACKQDIDYFEQKFPNGANLIDVINDKAVEKETLYWGFTHLNVNDEEAAAYYEKLGIVNSSDTYLSDKVVDSQFITHSSKINKSNYVFSSNDVTDSDMISSSTHIKNSHFIFSSKFVFNSTKVVGSSNITDSTNVANSVYVDGGRSVYKSNVVTNGFGIILSKNLTNCYFCMNCENLTNCLFCSNLKEKEYCVFNKPVPPVQFERIVSQLLSLIDQELYIIDDTEYGDISGITPHINNNFKLFYKNLDNIDFYDWTATLPTYDKQILYQITFNDRLLK